MNKQFNILWTGREYYSLENCLVNITAAGAEITSVIVGRYENKLYRVDYHIKTDEDLESDLLHITSRHSNRELTLRIQRGADGQWTVNGEKNGLFDGCTDFDIAVTPFTNTLPINRLKMKIDQEQPVRVIYFDPFEQTIRPVQQKYLRLSDTKYHYENIPNDFEADIVVDENGLVVDYPLLFTRTAILPASYR